MFIFLALLLLLWKKCRGHTDLYYHHHLLKKCFLGAPLWPGNEGTYNQQIHDMLGVGGGKCYEEKQSRLGDGVGRAGGYR